MAEEDKESAYEFLGEIHGENATDAVEGAQRLGLRYDLTITQEDILIYLARHPYLQLLNLDPTFEDFEEVKVTKSKAGWSIQDFGDALSSSQGEALYNDYGPITIFANQPNEDEDGSGDLGGSDLIPGMGTVVKQAFDTAVSMVNMINGRWSGVHIVAGSEIMKWAAWVAASDLKLEVYGYEPDKQAEARYQRIRRYELQKASGKKPGQSRGD